MKLTGWFTQDKIADNNRIQIPDSENAEQANRQIRSLVPGQTLRGEIVSREGSNAQIRLLQDVLIDAKVDADIRLELGQNITFQVKSNGQTLNLSPLFTNMATEGTVRKALDMASLPTNENTVAMTKQLMDAGLPIDKNTLQQIWHESNTFPDAEIMDIVNLHRLELPVTEENVAKLSHAVDMASEIRSFSDAAMKFFIDNENTILTPESINAGVHGAVEGEENPSSEENDFSLVENQVRSRLEESGMEADDENMAAAKWLYEEDLPVTAENVALSSQVKDLKETKDSVLAARIADQMAEGVQPEKANLIKLSVAEAVRFKRRLAETQLTMTVDAIRTMSEKGISIDVTKLEDVVEKLRAAEKEAYQSELFNADLPVTEENVNTLKETSQAAKQVLSAPVEFMGYAFTQGVEDTLSSLSSKAEAFTASFDMVENRYESVGTEVRRDLGDSLTKAFSNIDTLLEEAGFETTARNERAVRALAYNQMPLTEENLVSVKEYDERVTTLMKNMKPEVVCELIRKGENPLEKTLDELQNDVNEILAENDIEDISFRKYLWKMDHTDGLTEDERETMIGVYRLLHQIEKSEWLFGRFSALFFPAMR